MKIQHIAYKIFALAALVLLVVGCGERSPGIEYAPQMYHSIPLEPFTQIEGVKPPFPDSTFTQQVPPEGTIAIDAFGAYPFADVPNYPDSAHLPLIQAMENPLTYSDEAMEEGKVLYERFCGICHGKTGQGDGNITKRPEIAPKPYNSPTVKDKTPGEIYHTMMVGLNVMGSYSSQLSFEDRWKVVFYVQKLQGNDPSGGTAEDGEESGDEATAEAVEEGEEAVDMEEGGDEEHAEEAGDSHE